MELTYCVGMMGIGDWFPNLSLCAFPLRYFSLPNVISVVTNVRPTVPSCSAYSSLFLMLISSIGWILDDTEPMCVRLLIRRLICKKECRDGVDGFSS